MNPTKAIYLGGQSNINAKVFYGYSHHYCKGRIKKYALPYKGFQVILRRGILV